MKMRTSFFGEWPILRTPTSREPSRDHQGQVSIIAACRSLMARNAPHGPQSLTCSGVGTAVPQTPRAIPWRARIGNELEASPVWSLALATSAAWWQLAGTNKAKQQANQHPNARCVSHKSTILRMNSHSIRIFSEVSQLAKIGTARKNSQKENFIVQASTHAVGSMSSMDTSKKQVQRDDSVAHAICIVMRNPS